MIAQTIQIGHLHPLLVHLPIGILAIGFILELLYKKKPSETAKDIVLVVLLIGFISSLVSLGSGWLLGEDGSYDETLLFRHRWLAVAFTVFTGLLYVLKKSTNHLAGKTYFPVFIITLILLSITGHYGGSMTHGEDYLFADNKEEKVIIENVDEALVYTDIVQPIFNAKCVSCHNPSKVKGGLLMNNQTNLLAGGDSGSILDSVSKTEPSLMLMHLRLPLEHEDHMPPKGKIQPTAEELQLIEWWMTNNNCFDCVAGPMDKSEELQKILKSLEVDNSPRALIAKEVEPVSYDWLLALNNSNISASTLAEDNPLVEVSLYGRKDLTKQDFKILKKYAKNIVELNLGNTNFNDTLAAVLPSFKHLTKLQLQRTGITDLTVDKIAELDYLESLNLYGNAVNDESLTKLNALPNLTNLYLFGTNVTSKAIAKYTSAHPKTVVEGQVDSELFKPTRLEPPIIIADKDFFKDSLQIELDYAFDDVDIHFTLDGSEPDAKATKYTQPILITESTLLKAVTVAEDYKPSKLSESDFKRFKYDYAGIALNKSPNERYKGHGAATLNDLKRGSTNFVDGNWLGFEGRHITATVELGKKETISTVSVGTLSSPEKWIFYPTGFNVWTSTNGTDFKLVKRHKVGTEKINTLTRFRFFDVHIPPTQAKYVRVEVKSQLKNPSWHPNPGGKSWLFVDEIVLN
ncbi:FN3 associated domain-containing protein [Maribacter sp. HTCC2170]|uniref:FN3 associated domain-containing protein n=1 Tax=Maribacter sp. (strain HTCC2170 / KCCM 42371) TaxID=313603 RepID=UPI00006BE097|nr:FN3 associated domain-containing protein [Maribacter sp. HTCC2170]EAR00001.1 beta-hexosaminidase precursor [Maribacter sp. HTCC2170]